MQPFDQPRPPALEAEQVSKRYPGDVLALDRVSASVEAGRTLALVGESGSGKTTFLRLFNRMVEPSRGSVRVGGMEVAAQDAVALRRRIGYVPQHGGLLPHWTAQRNVELVPELEGWERERRRDRSHELLALVGLEPELHGRRYPRELSGGQRQRVSIARALALDPDLILLDEPLGALDALTRLELQRELLRLKRELGKTMLLVTHDLAEAFRLGDQVGVMKSGRLRQLATPERLRSQPADDYVEALVAEFERAWEHDD